MGKHGKNTEAPRSTLVANLRKNSDFKSTDAEASFALQEIDL